MSEILAKGAGYKITKQEGVDADMKYDITLYLTGETKVLTKASEINRQMDVDFDVDNVEKWIELFELFVTLYSKSEDFDKAMIEVEEKYAK